MSQLFTLNRTFLLPWVCAAILIGGCSGLETDYGDSRGVVGAKSLNGFGTLRRAYNNAGFKTRDVTRLTTRVRKLQVVVWTPKQLDAVPDDVTGWFDSWLRRGDRTLVYVIPDSGSEAAYWQVASKLAPGPQRLEYRKRAAKAVNQRMVWRMNRREVTSNGWFSAKPIQHPNPLTGVNGKWVTDFDAHSEIGNGENEKSETAIVASSSGIQPEFSIVAYEPPKPAASAKGTTPANAGGNPTPTAAKPATTPPTTAPGTTAPASTGPTSPASIGWSMPIETSPTSTKVEFEPVLTTSPAGSVSSSGPSVSANPSSNLVATIRSPRWKNSRIIVVGGGSFVTNYGLTQPLGQTIAANLISESAQVNQSYSRDFVKQAGFLTTDWRGVSISERDPNAPQSSGMELLTQWPISLITIHGVLLGFIICLVLFPIFGRPKSIDVDDHSDFSDHLDAVAALMSRTDGQEYARQRISEYYKRVRGEQSGPWAENDQRSQPKPAESNPTQSRQ